jgi:ectoine hydroxylase-related dioxygenase (phytanoyl-CoA dioxygenase family)
MVGGLRRQLEELGYAVLDGFMYPELLWDLRARTDQLFETEGDAAGSEFRIEPNTRRLANLVAKGEVYERIVSSGHILGLVEPVLGKNFKLSSLNARVANPQSNSRQPLHVDMGLLPDDKGNALCNTLWMLDDFTTENGALRVVPGSHLWRKRPEEELSDPYAPHPTEVLVTGRAGTVVVMNGHLWHGGTENRTDLPRRALHALFCRWDIPQQQYQKQSIPPEVQARFSAELRRVLALDDSLNDQLSAPMKRASGFLR